MSAEVITNLSTTVGLILAIGGGFAWMLHRMDAVRDELKGDIVELGRDVVQVQKDVVQVHVSMARLEGRLEGRAEATPAG